MEGIICGPSALSYLRTPPQVLDLLPSIPISQDRATQTFISTSPAFKELFGETVHTLVSSVSEHTNAEHIKQHLWSGPLPPQATIDDPAVGTVTSPLLTLLTLAQHCTDIELAMIMHEFCGEFAVYRPSDEVEKVLPKTNDARLAYGWERAPSKDKRPSSLWQRSHLVEPHELASFAREVRGHRGARRFERAAAMLQGVTLSPLEVRTALLMGLPRTLGGRGIKIETNATIRFTQAASKIAHRSYCIADILITSPDGTHVVDVECQGASVHDGIEARISDANRTTALESMGVSVILVSHDQIASHDSFNVVMDLVERELGQRIPAQTSRMVKSEKALRGDLFQEWETLGMAQNDGKVDASARTRAEAKAKARGGAKAAAKPGTAKHKAEKNAVAATEAKAKETTVAKPKQTPKR